MGGAFKPFDPSNKDNLTPRIEIDRFSNRKQLLGAIGSAAKDISGTGAESVGFYKGQAYDVILGSAKDAFGQIKKQNKLKLCMDQKSERHGEQMLLARRLVNTVQDLSLSLWRMDMHTNISDALKKEYPPSTKPFQDS